jgi:YHS domain-containing protein
LAGVEKPVAMTVKGETVYVCCQNCANKVRMNPEPYLAKVRAEREGNSTTHPAMSVPVTSALPLGGQKSCPVTGEPLDPSSAVAVMVRGQTIYVCCQGCAAKVRRDPEPYLAKVMAERGSLNGSHP